MSELIGLLVFIAATIFIIVDSFRDTKDKFIAIWSLGSGFAVRMSLMLSATMFVSWHRTLIYFYYGMIVAIVMMLEYLDKDKKWQVHACRFLIVCGVIVNVFLTVGHQLRLG